MNGELLCPLADDLRLCPHFSYRTPMNLTLRVVKRVNDGLFLLPNDEDRTLGLVDCG